MMSPNVFQIQYVIFLCDNLPHIIKTGSRLMFCLRYTESQTLLFFSVFTKLQFLLTVLACVASLH